MLNISNIFFYPSIIAEDIIPDVFLCFVRALSHDLHMLGSKDIDEYLVHQIQPKTK